MARSEAYLRLCEEEALLLSEVRTAPTVKARTAKYVAWQQIRRARRAALQADKQEDKPSVRPSGRAGEPPAKSYPEQECPQ